MNILLPEKQTLLPVIWLRSVILGKSWQMHSCTWMFDLLWISGLKQRVQTFIGTRCNCVFPTETTDPVSLEDCCRDGKEKGLDSQDCTRIPLISASTTCRLGWTVSSLFSSISVILIPAVLCVTHGQESITGSITESYSPPARRVSAWSHDRVNHLFLLSFKHAEGFGNVGWLAV